MLHNPIISAVPLGVESSVELPVIAQGSLENRNTLDRLQNSIE
jgi:hypothetical protein